MQIRTGKALSLLALGLMLPMGIARGQATGSLCNDGTTSASTGKGTCSGHGGVKSAAATQAGKATTTKAKSAPKTESKATTKTAAKTAPKSEVKTATKTPAKTTTKAATKTTTKAKPDSAKAKKPPTK